MALTVKRLVPGSVLTGSPVTYYTAPANKFAQIKSITVANTTGAAVAVTLYVVPAGQTASAAYQVRPARVIDVNESYSCPEMVNHTIDAGGTIQASGAGLTLIVSGTEGVNS